MKVTSKRSGYWRGSQWLLAVITFLLGCGPANQPAASGRILLPSSDVFTFADDTLELRSKNNPNQLAFGKIQPDGSFQIESLINGEVVRGAPAGTYQARLVIADDDYQHKQAAAKAIPKKFFNFDSSALVVEVPGNNIQLSISK